MVYCWCTHLYLLRRQRPGSDVGPVFLPTQERGVLPSGDVGHQFYDGPAGRLPHAARRRFGPAAELGGHRLVHHARRSIRGRRRQLVMHSGPVETFFWRKNIRHESNRTEKPSCRERVCPYVSNPVVRASLKKKTKQK